MTKNKIVGAIAALGLLTAPAVAMAHGGGDDHGSKGREHAKQKHQNQKGKYREVTGKATGTVQSFADKQLTIALPDGKTYTALVTRKTIIKCRTAAPQPSSTTPSTTEPTTTAPATTSTPASTVLPVKAKKASHGDDGKGRHGKGGVNGNGRCGTDALVAGAQVTAAKLSLKGGVATWKKVELLK